MRIIFMGTPDFAVPTLESLHLSNHTIAAVYSQPPRPAGRGQKEKPSPVHAYASAHNLKVLTPTSLKSKEAQDEFALHNADIAIVVAYGLLLPKEILDICPYGCVNVHPSKLPRWRGAAPLQRTIMAGDTETAIIIMQMDEGLDTGDILLSEPYAIAAGTTAGALHDDIANKAGPLVLKALDGLANKSITAIKQSEEGITYAKKILKEERQIDWSKPASDVYYHILGLSPFPGATFHYNDEVIKIHEASLEAEISHELIPGTLIDDSLTVACGQGAIKIQTLQRPGKKPMPAGELLRGYPMAKGTVLS